MSLPVEGFLIFFGNSEAPPLHGQPSISGILTVVRDEPPLVHLWSSPTLSGMFIMKWGWAMESLFFTVASVNAFGLWDFPNPAQAEKAKRRYFADRWVDYAR